MMPITTPFVRCELSKQSGPKDVVHAATGGADAGVTLGAEAGGGGGAVIAANAMDCRDGLQVLLGRALAAWTASACCIQAEMGLSIGRLI